MEIAEEMYVLLVGLSLIDCYSLYQGNALLFSWSSYIFPILFLLLERAACSGQGSSGIAGT